MSKLFFLTILLPFLARADALEQYPGWNLVPHSENTEYFTLSPGDGRPSVSIDAGAAERIRSGELDPGAIYRNASVEAKNTDEENIYGKGTLITPAEPVLSTATAENRSAEPVQEKEDGLTTARAPASSLPLSTASTLPQSNNGTAPLASSGGNKQNEFTKNQSIPSLKNIPKLGEAPIAPEPSKSSVAYPSSISGEKNQKIGSTQPISIGIAQPDKKSITPGTGPTSTGLLKEYTPPTGKEAYEPCKSGKQEFTTPGDHKIAVAKGCRTFMVSAWGAGGGAGVYQFVTNSESGDTTQTQRVPGGGGSYVMASGTFDGSVFDLMVTVGGAGGDASLSGGPGKAGVSGGGAGGASSVAPGGGGGGYSALFLFPKSGGAEGHANVDRNLVVAGGGGGGSGRYGNGFPAGLEKGGGGASGATQTAGGLASGNGSAGGKFKAGDGGKGIVTNPCAMPSRTADACMVYGENGYVQTAFYDDGSVGGGGGGGGFFGGGGGAGAGNSSGAGGGGGGSSFSSVGGMWEAASGASGGGHYIPGRGSSADAGQHGKVIVEWH